MNNLRPVLFPDVESTLQYSYFDLNSAEFLTFVSFIGLVDKKSACPTYLSAHWTGKTSAGI
jgi:hypothetical protein